MSLVRRTALGAVGGATIGALFLLVGLVRALIALRSGANVTVDEPSSLPAQMAFYVLGFVGAGAVSGFLWPLTNSRLGTCLLGVVGMSIPVAAVVSIEDGPPWTWSTQTRTIWLLMTLVFGLAAALGIMRGKSAA